MRTSARWRKSTAIEGRFSAALISLAKETDHFVTMLFACLMPGRRLLRVR